MTAPPDLAGLIARGQAARRAGDRAAALAAFQAALVLAPAHRGVRREVAWDLRALGRGADAAAIYRALLDEAPDDAAAMAGLGLLAREAGDGARACALFADAVARDPADPALRLELAASHEADGAPDAARGVLRAALDRWPRLEAGWLALLRLERLHGAGGAARAVTQAGLAVLPVSPALLVEAAAEAQAAGDGDGARALLERAGAVAPDDLGLLLHHAERAWVAREDDDAEAMLRRAVALHPGTPAPACRLALMLAELGRGAEALGLLDGAAPGLAVRWARAGVRRLAGDWDAALEELAVLPAGDFALWLRRAELRVMVGAFAAFDADADAAPVRTRHERADWHRVMGERAEAGWDFEAAARHFAACVAANPRDGWAMLLLARAHLMRFDPDAARDALARHLALDRAAAALRGAAPNLSQSHLGQLLDEFRLDGGLCAALRAVAAMPAGARIAGLVPLVQEHPGHTPVAIALLVALRQAGVLAGDAAAGAQVPRRIVRFWDSGPPPADVAALMATWPAAHPGWTHEVFDDRAAGAWLAAHGPAGAAEAFGRLREAAARADLFRLAWLAAEGGVYADADDRCLRPLDDVLAGVRLLAYQEEYGTLGNNVLAAVPGHPAIVAARDMAIAAVNRGDSDILWLRTGPGVLSRGYAQAFARGADLSGTMVLERHALRRFVAPHAPAAYKRTPRHWVRSVFG